MVDAAGPTGRDPAGVGLIVNQQNKRMDDLREGMKAMDARQREDMKELREDNKALNEKLDCLPLGEAAANIRRCCLFEELPGIPGRTIRAVNSGACCQQQGRSQQRQDCRRSGHGRCCWGGEGLSVTA